MPYANNKDADQPAHRRSLISAFVVRCLDSIISRVSLCAISWLYLVSVAEQIGSSLSWSKTLKGITLTSNERDLLHSYFHEPQKNEIHLIFILCFHTVFVHNLWNFYLNLANKRQSKVIIRRVWLLHSTAVTMTWRQSNVTLANQLLHLSMTSLTGNVTSSLTGNVTWTSVVHGCMNLIGPK